MSVSVYIQVCGATTGKDTVKNQRNPSNHCPSLKTPALGDSSLGELSRGCLGCLFMNHRPAGSCLVASGGGDVTGGWVLQLQASAPSSAVDWLPRSQEPCGHCVRPQRWQVIGDVRQFLGQGSVSCWSSYLSPVALLMPNHTVTSFLGQLVSQ